MIVCTGGLRSWMRELFLIKMKKCVFLALHGMSRSEITRMRGWSTNILKKHTSADLMPPSIWDGSQKGRLTMTCRTLILPLWQILLISIGKSLSGSRIVRSQRRIALIHDALGDIHHINAVLPGARRIQTEIVTVVDGVVARVGIKAGISVLVVQRVDSF